MVAPVVVAEAGQPPLFPPGEEGPRKVIRFDHWRSSRVDAPAPRKPSRTTSKKKHTPGRTTVEQATLEFVPPPQSKSRKLGTEVDAQIYCDLPAAPRTLRCAAASIDAALVLIGFGLVAGISLYSGAGFGAGKQFWLVLGAAFGLVSLFYDLVWAIAGTETLGMRLVGLHLITFDGFPVGGPTRALRLISGWLSVLSGGLGVLWAMADEERLTWHDHVSKTFPVVRERAIRA